jgi:hypothetical protein
MTANIQPHKEITMTTQLSTQLSTKLAALAAALMVNGAMLGGVAYLLSAQLHQPAGSAMVVTASARAPTPRI